VSDDNRDKKAAELHRMFQTGCGGTGDRVGLTQSLQKTALQMQKYSAIHGQNKPEAYVSVHHQQ